MRDTQIYNTKTKEMEPYMPVEETATEQVETSSEENAKEIVEEVKQEVDNRDSDILSELQNIHKAITAQNEHLMNHLEGHAKTVEPASASELEKTASGEANQVEQKKEPGASSSAVSMEIQEAKDLPKTEESKRPKKFGKRGRR
jgi:hypothetical protein